MSLTRILISGGPGSGCTSTASAVANVLKIPVFDSDAFFHKPSDPPFQQQYSPEERCELLNGALATESSWVLSGSVATWGAAPLDLSHGVFLHVPRETRLRRLEERQRQQFGPRIDQGGDMQAEHASFMEWAAGYEERTVQGRNLTTDRHFLESNCDQVIFVTEDQPFLEVVFRIVRFATRSNPRRTSA